MNKADWNKGLDAWTKIKEQAQIDIEQADLYISAIKQKLNKMKEE